MNSPNKVSKKTIFKVSSNKISLSLSLKQMQWLSYAIKIYTARKCQSKRKENQSVLNC